MQDFGVQPYQDSSVRDRWLIGIAKEHRLLNFWNDALPRAWFSSADVLSSARCR